MDDDEDSVSQLPELRQHGRASVIEQAKKHIGDWPRLEQYKGGKPWLFKGTTPQQATPSAIMQSITTQVLQTSSGEDAQGVISKRQVARLILDTSKLAEASIKMKQACSRATRLITDVEKLHNVEDAVAQASERYDAVKGEGTRVVILRDNEVYEEEELVVKESSSESEETPETVVEEESDEEEDEFESEPTETVLEDVTDMPPGRISHRAMDMLITLAPDLALIADTAKALQTELGITSKNPSSIRPSVRPRDCRSLTMKIMWLQKKVAGCMDTIRSYMVIATKSMNEHARSALREIKQLKQQVASLEATLKEKEQQIEEMEFKETERDANTHTSGELSSHPITALLDANKPLLNRLHKKLLLAADDYLLEEKEHIKKPEKRGKTGKAAASRQAELDMVRNYSELLDKLQQLDIIKRKPACDLEMLVNQVSIVACGTLPPERETATAMGNCIATRKALILNHRLVVSCKEAIQSSLANGKLNAEPFLSAVADIEHENELNLQGYQHVLASLAMDKILKDVRSNLKLIKDIYLQRLLTLKNVPRAAQVVLDVSLSVLNNEECRQEGSVDWTVTKNELSFCLATFVLDLVKYTPAGTPPLPEYVVEYLNTVDYKALPKAVQPIYKWLLGIQAAYQQQSSASWVVKWPSFKPTTLQEVASSLLSTQGVSTASVTSLAVSLSGHLAACLLLVADLINARSRGAHAPGAPTGQRRGFVRK